jgi:hypothetical protein
VSPTLDATRLPVGVGVAADVAVFGQIQLEPAGRAGAVPGPAVEGDRHPTVDTRRPNVCSIHGTMVRPPGITRKDRTDPGT